MMISINGIIFSNYMICEFFRSHPWRHGNPPDIQRISAMQVAGSGGWCRYLIPNPDVRSGFGPSDQLTAKIKTINNSHSYSEVNRKHFKYLHTYCLYQRVKLKRFAFSPIKIPLFIWRPNLIVNPFRWWISGAEFCKSLRRRRRIFSKVFLFEEIIFHEYHYIRISILTDPCGNNYNTKSRIYNTNVWK